MRDPIFGRFIKFSKSFIVVVFNKDWVKAKAVSPSFLSCDHPFAGAGDCFLNPLR